MASKNMKLTTVCATCGCGFHPRYDSPRQRYCSHSCVPWDAVREGVRNSPDKVRMKLQERSTRKFGCWIWQGAKNSHGYGDISIDGRLEKAHRASYIVFKGPIPEGMFVCHACDTPSCVNPDHLWLGTPADNSDDKVRKGRHKTQSSPKKLTRRSVEDIRAATAETGLSLARKYGVSAALISQIRSGKKWKGA